MARQQAFAAALREAGVITVSGGQVGTNGGTQVIDLKVQKLGEPKELRGKLIPSDTGRPITDITSDLEYPDLADDAQEVLRTHVFKEKPAATRDSRWFTVRVMSYRTLENVIDGSATTFTDVKVNRVERAKSSEDRTSGGWSSE